MEKERFTIDYPDETSTIEQINKIVSQGLRKPKTFGVYLKEMYQQLGLRYLFRDATEVIFVLMLGIAVFCFGSYQAIENHMQVSKLYSFIFILSPLLYFLIASIFLINARQKDTFEVEMACKYHVFQLAAFRMLIFSIVTLLINMVLVIVWFRSYQSVNLLEALFISISSLSIFATIYLYILQKVKSRFVNYGIITAWLLINLVPAVYSHEFYTFVLRQIPIYVYIIVALGCFYAYVQRLKYFITFRNVEGVL